MKVEVTIGNEKSSVRYYVGFLGRTSSAGELRFSATIIKNRKAFLSDLYDVEDAGYTPASGRERLSNVFGDVRQWTNELRLLGDRSY